MNTNTHINVVAKPKVSLVGVNGDVQKLVERVSEAMRMQGHPASAMLMVREIERYGMSFMAAFAIAHRYVEFG